MKKIVTIIFIVSVSVGNLNAQIEKGSIFLGTSTSVTGSSYSFLTNSDNSIGITFSSIEWSGEDEKENFTVLNFSPKLGYFPVNNLVIGANMKLWSQKMDDDKTSVTGIGPFVRYYFTNGKIVPFAEAEITFSKYKETWDSDYSDGESTENLTILAIGGGLAFFVTDFINIDCMAGYKTVKLKDPDADVNGKVTFNNFGLVVGFTVAI